MEASTVEVVQEAMSDCTSNSLTGAQTQEKFVRKLLERRL